jgi:hypothetical protein
MVEVATYHGSCHCGAVRFQFCSPPITAGCRCNCSICIRKGATMSTEYFAPEAFQLLQGADVLEIYRWGDRLVNHYFCRRCGIHAFHDATEKPGHYRVNLGCVAELDPLALKIDLIDGRSF